MHDLQTLNFINCEKVRIEEADLIQSKSMNLNRTLAWAYVFDIIIIVWRKKQLPKQHCMLLLVGSVVCIICLRFGLQLSSYIKGHCCLSHHSPPFLFVSLFSFSLHFTHFHPLWLFGSLSPFFFVQTLLRRK